MSWTFVESQRSFHGAQLPSMTLRFQAEFEWNGPEEIEVASVRMNPTLPDLTGVAWPEIAVPFGGGQFGNRHPMTLNVALPVERRFVEAVEAWRQGRGVPVRIQGYVNITYRKLREVSLPGPERVVVRDFGRPEWAQVRFELSAQRDQWLDVLKQLGWNEFEVFEMGVRPLRRDERFKKAFAFLNEAQVALRQGQWSTTVTDCRKAVEAAASVSLPDSDRRSQYEALVKQVLPNEHDGAKRETLAGLMVALRELRNEAAHGHNLNAQVEREDAELAFSVAVGIFRYIGESLARRTTS